MRIEQRVQIYLFDAQTVNFEFETNRQTASYSFYRMRTSAT